ncbi:hypothetical protein VP01_139g2 [Puccinia sorghi]|uniref:Uncharacterized protein n=1 Tax=Puccinia sorghi TaxID=27349 RepID=A0A0L6VKZ8_9BASI|nr:hypothetical protein VP01_139g2 [Puccinia sorghi]
MKPHSKLKSLHFNNLSTNSHHQTQIIPPFCLVRLELTHKDQPYSSLIPVASHSNPLLFFFSSIRVFVEIYASFHLTGSASTAAHATTAESLTQILRVQMMPPPSQSYPARLCHPQKYQLLQIQVVFPIKLFSYFLLLFSLNPFLSSISISFNSGFLYDSFFFSIPMFVISSSRLTFLISDPNSMKTFGSFSLFVLLDFISSNILFQFIGSIVWRIFCGFNIGLIEGFKWFYGWHNSSADNAKKGISDGFDGQPRSFHIPLRLLKYFSWLSTLYGSDVWEGQIGQTSRVKTLVKRPCIFQPSSDSQNYIGQPINIVRQNSTKQEKNLPSDSETESQNTPIDSKKNGKNPEKNPPTFSKSTLDPRSSQSLMISGSTYYLGIHSDLLVLLKGFIVDLEWGKVLRISRDRCQEKEGSPRLTTVSSNRLLIEYVDGAHMIKLLKQEAHNLLESTIVTVKFAVFKYYHQKAINKVFRLPVSSLHSSKTMTDTKEGLQVNSTEREKDRKLKQNPALMPNWECTSGDMKFLNLIKYPASCLVTPDNHAWCITVSLFFSLKFHTVPLKNQSGICALLL